MPGPRRTVDLADVPIELTAETVEQHRFLHWHFGRLPPVDARAQLRIELRDAGHAQPTDAPSMHDGPIARWDAPSGLQLAHQLGGTAELDDGRLVIGGDPGPALRWRVVRQLLFSSLSWFFDQRGLLMLHAAMLGRGTDAMLVTGSTGMGKSTTCVAALVAGWEVLSDDLVVVRPGANAEAAVFGVPKRMTVAADLAAQLDVRVEPLPGDERIRMMLPIETLTVGWRHVRALVRVEHDGGSGHLQEMAHGDAIQSVLAGFLEAGRADAVRRQFSTLAWLAGRPSFVLAHAADAGQRVPRAIEMLEDAWQRAADRVSMTPEFRSASPGRPTA